MKWGHGDDRYLYPGVTIRHDFSSNVATWPLPDSLRSAYIDAWDDVTRYPTPDGRELSAALTEHHSLASQSILPTAGAVDGIYLVAEWIARLKGADAPQLVASPTFSEYSAAASRIGQSSTINLLFWLNIGADSQMLLSRLNSLSDGGGRERSICATRIIRVARRSRPSCSPTGSGASATGFGWLMSRMLHLAMSRRGSSPLCRSCPITW